VQRLESDDGVAEDAVGNRKEQQQDAGGEKERFQDRGILQ